MSRLVAVVSCCGTFALSLGLAACAKGKPASGSPSVDATSAVAPEVAGSLDAPTGRIDAIRPVAGQPSFVDSPAWPSVGENATLKLTWAVYPMRQQREGDLRFDGTSRRVELVARIGGIARHLDLGIAHGSLLATNQGVCHGISSAKRPGDIAEITFEVGGSSGFSVHRSRVGGDAGDRGREGDFGRDGDLGEVFEVFEVVRWYETDGLCVDARRRPVDCGRDEKPVLAFHAPLGIAITEALVEVEGPGREHPFDCGPP